MSNSIRNGIRAGSTFAVIIIFLELIGFTVIGSTLIGKVLGNAPQSGAMPPVINLVIFLGLLGLWNGANAAKPDPRGQTFSQALTAGVAAGAFCGLWVAIYALIMGYIQSLGIDLRVYLSAISPESNALSLFGLPGTSAALAHLGLQTGMGALGALLALGLRSGLWRRTAGSGWASTRRGVSGVVAQVRRFPYAVYVMYGLLAIIMIAAPHAWGSYWNYITGTVGIYVIMGLGLNIITGLAGQLVLGYVAFFAIGAYSVALLTAPQPQNIRMDFWPALLIGIVLAGLTGVLLGLPILRLRGDYLAIVTLGFGEIIRIMLRSDLLTPLTAGPHGVRDIGQPALFGMSLSSDVNFLYLILLAMVLAIFITNRLQNSRTGRAWVAIREDEVAAKASGINVFQSKLLALAIGAAFAGLGGVLFASRNQFTGPEDHALMVSINVLALVIVGGMGSLPGIILGAFALKGLPEILRELENYRLMVFGALLVVMMILRPEGLWPASRPRLEKKDRSAPPVREEEPAPMDAEGVKNANHS